MEYGTNPQNEATEELIAIEWRGCYKQAPFLIRSCRDGNGTSVAPTCIKPVFK